MANWIISQTADIANGIKADAFRRDIYPIAYIGDQNAHVWQVTVTNNGKPENLANHTVIANFLREYDNATIAVVGSIENNVASVYLPQEVYAYQCRVTGVLRLNRTGVSTTIAAIAFRVGANMTDTIIDPGEAIPDINVLLDEVERLEIANSQAENLVLIQTEQPTEPANKLWVQPTDRELIVPTWGEFSDLDAAKIDAPINVGTAGDILSLNSEMRTQWKTPAAPTDAQVTAAVDDWLDEHPEATTTVQDGAITESKLDSRLSRLVKSKPLNVLYLGVKNDGSEDCSGIINNATEDYELYFPSGIYRVDNPIYIKHSVYGAGASRQFTRGTPSQGTRLVSHIVASADSVGVININNGSCDVLGIAITCNSNEDGILFAPSSSSITVKIQNVTICNLGDATGIRVLPDQRCSRAVYIENCSIFGRGSDSASRGVLVGANAYDSLITNCEIMAVKYGIVSRAQIRMSNVHVWTGLLGGQSADPWWSETVGITTSGELYANNTYVDSAYVSFYVNTDKKVSLKNTIIWNDSSMDSSAYNSQSVFYVSDVNLRSKLLLTVDGITIKDNGRVSQILSANARGLGVTFKDVHIISDKENVPSNLVMGAVGNLYPDDHFSVTVPAGNLAEVAYIFARYGGLAEIDVYCDNSRVKTVYTRTNTSKPFSIDARVGTQIRLFWAQVDDLSGNRCVKLYAMNTTNSAVQMVVRRFSSSTNARMTSYYSSTATGQTRLVPEILTSAEGLTEVTE